MKKSLSALSPRIEELCNTPESKKARVRAPSPNNASKKMKSSTPEPIPGKLWAATDDEEVIESDCESTTSRNQGLGDFKAKKIHAVVAPYDKFIDP